MTITHRCTRAIKASKMFRASSRKSKIMAELEKPENIELVKQLDEYLDEEYQVLNEPAETTTEDVTEVTETDEVVDDSPASGGGGHGSPASFTPHESLMDKHGDELEELENEGEGEVPAEEPEDKTPEASVKLTGKAITADTIVNPFVDYYATLNSIAGEIKGTLNARQDTAGVDRVQLKNDELWIYYNDSMNLNNVMSNVIGLLAAANYKYLEFNRLARSDNAMVFTLCYENTDGGVAGAAIKADEK
ncbi:hypothetical protein [Ruminococcus sp.]|uniref:hypothetical protein n=1 Tax=Ruminococcus sp. TaxID=41978 RepID=UPI001B76A1B7|nr:hypothetical protein [Ruminococcus sp.]MBP5433585.1 hypothetical protein [Ruminococcus sp.]